MSRKTKVKPEKAPFSSRIAGYGARRIAHRGEHVRRRLHVMKLKDALKGAVAVEKIDILGARQGWHGRYEDGGREAFAQLMEREGIDERALEAISRQHSVASAAYLATALSLLVLSVAQFVSYDLTLGVMAVAMQVASLPLVALALRHAFAGWQVRQRRFGGLGEYLRGET